MNQRSQEAGQSQEEGLLIPKQPLKVNQIGLQVTTPETLWLGNDKQQVPLDADPKQACALDRVSAKTFICFAKLMCRGSLQCLCFLELSCMTVPCSLKCVNV